MTSHTKDEVALQKKISSKVGDNSATRAQFKSERYFCNASFFILLF